MGERTQPLAGRRIYLEGTGGFVRLSYGSEVIVLDDTEALVLGSWITHMGWKTKAQQIDQDLAQLVEARKERNA